MSLTKTIVYDWNGTLLDDADASCQSFNIIMAHFGYAGATIDAYRDHFDMPIEKLYVGLGVPENDVISKLSNMKDLFHATYEPLADTSPLRKGAEELLKTAHSHGVTQLLLSNHLVEPIARQLTRFDLHNQVSKIIANQTKETQFKEGPKGEKLRRYMAANDLLPENTVIVGDSPEEMDIARDLGLESFAITGGYVSEARLKNSTPTYLVHDFNEMLDILNNNGFMGKGSRA